METLTKDLSNLIINEVDLINEKVKGLNFLEILKLKLIEKIIPIINLQKFPLDKSFEFKTKSENNHRISSISINYFNNAISITRKKIEQDSLFISFFETTNLDIFSNKDQNRYKSLLLYKNTGVCLPQETQINAKLNKNTLFIEINNKDLEQALTNLKKI